MSFSSDSEQDDGKNARMSAPTANTIALTVAAEPPENAFVDNYHIDASNDDESLSEKMVHYVRGHLLLEHWVACKATLVFHAGATTTRSTVMTKRGKEADCLEVYKQALAKLDTSHFSVECRSFFMHSFKKKDCPMTGGALWRYFNESQTKMRCSIMPLLLANFIDIMKSGKGFHDTFNEMFRSQFWRELRKKMRACLLQKSTKSYPLHFGNTKGVHGTLDLP
jgi:hypothetical protein